MVYAGQVSSGVPPGDTAPATAPDPPSAPDRGACLFVIGQGNLPAALPARLALKNVDEIAVRRGAQRELALRTARHYDLVVDDPRVSSSHARFARLGRAWHVEDRGSRNGTFVNGQRVDRAELADLDVIDLGHTLLRYRTQIEGRAPEAFELSPADDRGLVSILPSVQQHLAELRTAATSGITVLLQGETGTGKEVVARTIHQLSKRSGDFVAINCGALPRERVAAELFGWKRGAFPGAIADQIGLIRAADRGTLLLDEIGDLPASDQAALLRVLQEREVLPIAATRAVSVDLRVIAATHQPLDELVERDAFRRDLLARLSGFRTTLPPLRERKEDLGLLLSSLLAGRPDVGGVVFHVSALRALVAYDWPANIRELEQALTYALVRRDPGGAIEAKHLPSSVTAPRSASDAPSASREQLIALLRMHRGNITAIASELGKARMQIHRWLKRHDLDPDHYR